ncbi:MAG: 2-amino-4-hydroxy-6-hydroxymethyldihydropteridine diphosphokinase [Candidatus Krumholzibacteriota bacterium]|nr:2-amino-4-hydroxy-6-hydroxymethyldihydropteridine diphosphokinase [Candidatus Krumholzibacteriota bacterium]
MWQSSSNAGPDSSPVGAVLSLGSNLGTREWYVLDAVNQLGNLPEISITGLSSLYETEPVGAGFTSSFVNAVCLIQTRFSPACLLAACQRIEASRGRRRGAGSGDRRLDIDIILYQEREIQTGELVIPHPRFRERRFVLVPLAEISPGLVLPPDGRRVERALADTISGGWVKKISSRNIASRTD